ncbi:MAG: type II secretion system protein [Paucibacter sp.]|nr:type II secretion system protein [Roseateles sp.]
MRTGRAGPADNRGFTYLWLLFVVALGGVALATLGQRQQTVQQREREAELRFRGDAIAKAIGAYVRASPAGSNSLPQRLEDLVEDKRSGKVQRHLRRLYTDPFTGRADWELIQGQLALQPPAQDGAIDESEQLMHKKSAVGAAPPGPSVNTPLGSASLSGEQGTALASGIVGVSSRSNALLMATGALAAAGATAGDLADSAPAQAPVTPAKSTKKPRVSDLQFLAAPEVLAFE